MCIPVDKRHRIEISRHSAFSLSQEFHVSPVKESSVRGPKTEKVVLTPRVLSLSLSLSLSFSLFRSQPTESISIDVSVRRCIRGGRLTDATVRARHRCRLTVLRQREENVEGNPPRTGTARGVRSILPVDILMPLTLSFPWKSRRAARAPHLRASARKRVLLLLLVPPPPVVARLSPQNRNKRNAPHSVYRSSFALSGQLL